MSVLMAEKSVLVDFQIQTFAGPLKRLGLSEGEWKILRLRMSEMSLTLPALRGVC